MALGTQWAPLRKMCDRTKRNDLMQASRYRRTSIVANSYKADLGRPFDAFDLRKWSERFTV